MSGFDIQFLQVNMAGGRIVTFFSVGPLFKITTYGDRHIIVSVVSKKFENKIVRLMEYGTPLAKL